MRHDVAAVRARLSPGTGYIAVVKADGYGHGATQVARAALEAGAAGLAVTTTEEAWALNDAGLGVDVLIMGPVLTTSRRGRGRRRGVRRMVAAIRQVGGQGGRRARRRVRLHLK